LHFSGSIDGVSVIYKFFEKGLEAGNSKEIIDFSLKYLHSTVESDQIDLMFHYTIY
jgi:hypothetical protein